MKNFFKDINKELDPEKKVVVYRLFSFFILVLMMVFVGVLYRDVVDPLGDFYNELWAPTYLLVHGQSPYDTASLNPEFPAAWFPMAIGFFFPLGWLSVETATVIWYWFNLIVISLIVYSSQGRPGKIVDVAVTALICFFSPIALNHINLGQFSLTVVLCWLLALKLRERSSHWLQYLFIALALTKPQLGTLVLLGFLSRDYVSGGMRVVFGSTSKIILMCLALCLPLFIAYPNWIPDMVTSMASNQPWAYPTLFVLFQKIFRGWGFVFWLAVLIFIVWVNFRIWRTLPSNIALYWSLAFSLLITPYAGRWDFVTLFPLIISSYTNINWWRKLIFWVAYVGAWAGMAYIQSMVNGLNFYFVWVPIWFIGVVFLLTRKINPQTAN